MRWILSCSLAAVLAVPGCARNATKSDSAENVPVGSEVQVTRQDGGVVEGKLTQKDDQALHVDVGPTTRAVPRSEIKDVRVEKPGESVEPPSAARFKEVTLPADTTIAVQLDNPLSSETNRVEDPVRGELSEALERDGATIFPAGSDVQGTVTNVDRAGKVKGRAALSVRFDTISAGGEVYKINARFARSAASGKTDDAKKIGIPAAGGAVIGAIIGGKKGAAIGAAAGGGAGAAVVLNTPGKPVEVPRGTVLSLELGQPVTVKVPIAAKE